MTQSRDHDPRHGKPAERDPATCDSPFLALWLSDQFAALHEKLDRIGKLITMNAQELKQELIDLNAKTTANGVVLTEIAATNAELASDIDDLLAGHTDLPADVVSALNEFKTAANDQSATLKATSDTLKALAAKHTPGSQP